MKEFKETFDLLAMRIRNLKGMITTLNFCIKTDINLDYNKSELAKAEKELNALILQDSQLRDFIIKENY